MIHNLNDKLIYTIYANQPEVYRRVEVTVGNPQTGITPSVIYAGKLFSGNNSNMYFRTGNILRDYMRSIDHGFESYFSPTPLGSFPHTDTEALGNTFGENPYYITLLNIKESGQPSTPRVIVMNNNPISSHKSSYHTELDNTLSGSVPRSFPWVIYNHSVLPHIPAISTENYFFSTAIYNNYISKGSRNLLIRNSRGDEKTYAISTDPSICDYMNVNLKNLFNGIDLENTAITNVGYDVDGVTSNEYTLAYIDQGCNIADFYLAWLNENYIYQSQGFSGKVIYSEDYNKMTVVDTDGNTNTAYTEVSSKWRLSTGWLTDEEYKAYMSLFTSQYLYLYNTKEDEGYYVNLSDKRAVQKTYNNDGMICLTINVELRNKNLI